MSFLISSTWSIISGGITAPEGFKAAGIKAGLKFSNKSDLALLLAPEGAVCSGTFTQSLVRAACIDLCLENLKRSGGRIRAVVINSGQANACTGERGLLDNQKIIEVLASALNLNDSEVLICSTGVIGVPILMDKLLAGVQPLIQGLSCEGGFDAAQSILTTDLVEKQVAVEANFGGRRVRIGGMAKGSGMIHPNMATMLAFITCDAGVAVNEWNLIVKRVVDSSFNLITVDGDTSTNDSVIAFAGGEPLDPQYLESLEVGLTLVTQYLAKAIARDGEGATCLLEVNVEGTSNNASARQIAKVVSGSALVKTAMHGCDPNWGRIVAAVGRAGVVFDPDLLSIWLGPFQLVGNGEPLPFDRDAASLYIQEKKEGQYLVNDCVSIFIKVGLGEGRGISWGCDLSGEYIKINADYTT